MKTIIDFYNTHKKRIATYEVIDAYKIVEKIDFYADDFGRLGYDRGYDVNDDAEEIHLYFQGKASNAKEFASFLLKNGYIREIQSLGKTEQEILNENVEKRFSILQKAQNSIKRWLKNNSRGNKFTIELPDYVCNKVKNLLKRDVKHQITIDGIIHGRKGHGKNGKKVQNGDFEIQDEDFDLIPYIMTAPDMVIKGSILNNRESIRFIKNISCGRIVVIEKEHNITPDTMETINIWGELSEATDANNCPDKHVRNAILSTSDRAKIIEDSKKAIVFDEKKKMESNNSQENLGSYVSNFVNDYKKTNEKLKNTLSTETGTFKFAQHLSELYGQGEKLDWLKAKKIAKDFDIETETEIMQACELGVVLEARRIANNGNSLRQQYEEMKDLYERQVTIRPLDTKSKVLQQYSTPCPLSYLLGRFVSKNDRVWNGKILEPSAGNGLLTIAFPPQQVCVNELDEIRVANLKNLGFSSVTNQNASSDLDLAIFPDKAFRGIMTNPPFAKLNENDKIERHGWKINTLDYKMAVLALDKMQDEGKSAVIVGGKLWNAYWKPLSERSEKQVLFGQYKTFLGYLYAQYNVVDVIYIDGDHIYQKQGTTYPIVVILIDGRHEYDESNKPRYVFDPYQDTILTTFDQLFDRLYPFIETKQDNSDDKSKKAKALMLKMKMIKIKL